MSTVKYSQIQEIRNFANPGGINKSIPSAGFITELKQYASKVLNENASYYNPVDTAICIAKRVDLQVTLQENFDRYNNASPLLDRRFPEAKAYLEDIKKEILEITGHFLPKVNGSLQYYGNLLKKQVSSKPDETIPAIAFKNFKETSLLTYLILSVSRLPKDSTTIETFKNIFSFVNAYCVKCAKSNNPETAKKAGKTLGLLTKAANNAENVLISALSSKNDSKSKNIEYSIAVIRDLSSLIIKFPTHTLALGIKNLFKSADQPKTAGFYKKRILTYYYSDKYPESFNNFVQGFSLGKEILEESL